MFLSKKLLDKPKYKNTVNIAAEKEYAIINFFVKNITISP